MYLYREGCRPGVRPCRDPLDTRLDTDTPNHGASLRASQEPGEPSDDISLTVKTSYHERGALVNREKGAADLRVRRWDVPVSSGQPSRCPGNRADAEDAVQDVFVSLVCSGERTGGVGDLGAYLFVSPRRC